MGEITRLIHTISTMGDLLGTSRTYTKRFMSPGGLNSHIYDVGETFRLIQQNATLDHTNLVGVHSNT